MRLHYYMTDEQRYRRVEGTFLEGAAFAAVRSATLCLM